MIIEHVYLDMDGVLVDFVGPALRLFDVIGRRRFWPPGVYDLPTAAKIPAAEFWAEIRAQPAEWWADLPATPWADALPRLVEAWPITITSKPTGSRAAEGKTRWLARQYGSPPPDFHLILPDPDGNARGTKAREIFEGLAPNRRSGRLLIDDSDAEVDAWKSRGGSALLWPCVWNSEHRRSGEPLIHLSRELSVLLERPLET